MTISNFSESQPEQRGATVAIVDDHLLLSEVMRAALLSEGFSVVVPHLDDMDSVKAELQLARPAVTLLDLDLGPLGSGEELLPRYLDSGSCVILVTATKDEAVIGRCLEAGAWGWVPKDSPVEVLIGATIRAAAGMAVMGEGDRDRYLRAWRQQQADDEKRREPFDALTRRESEVLAMLCDGKPVERIASESFVSEATVRSQVRAILTKLGVNSQLEAVAKATRAGWSRHRGP